MFKIEQSLVAGFSGRLEQAFRAKFGIEISTAGVPPSGSVVSFRNDGKALTPAQMDFIYAYSEGYSAAISQARVTGSH